MGDSYLRHLLITGSTTWVGYAEEKPATADPRFAARLARKAARVASVAIANAVAQVAWSTMARGGAFERGCETEGYDGETGRTGNKAMLRL